MPTAHRDYLLDGASSSSGLQVMAGKVNSGSITLAHVCINIIYLTAIGEPHALIFCAVRRDKVHLESFGSILGRLRDSTRHFYSRKCGRASNYMPSLTAGLFHLARSLSSPSSFRHSRRYLGYSACTMKASAQQSFVRVFYSSTSPSLPGGKLA